MVVEHSLRWNFQRICSLALYCHKIKHRSLVYGETVVTSTKLSPISWSKQAGFISASLLDAVMERKLSGNKYKQNPKLRIVPQQLPIKIIDLIRILKVSIKNHWQIRKSKLKKYLKKWRKMPLMQLLRFLKNFFSQGFFKLWTYITSTVDSQTIQENIASFEMKINYQSFYWNQFS